jgi:Subtilase family
LNITAHAALLVAAITAAAGLITAAAPEIADARWTRIASSPSIVTPFFVCPKQTRHARCQLIQDPTRGSRRRGPLAEGAITTGPEQQVSPAFYGGGVEGGYSPEDLRSAYDLPASSAGSGRTVAVVDAYDDPHAEADLNEYRREYGIPECTAGNGCFRRVNQEGGTTPPSPSKKWASEISLDLDLVSAICPSCHILLVEARSAEGADLAAAQEEAVTLGATSISDSYAEAESSENAAAYDHPGIPIAAAAGDSGYGVLSPAASPNVIAVGGTTLLPSSERRGWQESVWWDEGSGEFSGTGSGCSLEPKPRWQDDSGCAYRTTNDIAAVADPNTPVSVYDSYETSSHWLLLGGTSAAAPIVAAAMAQANAYTRSFDGAQGLYLEALNGASFNDVVSGMDGRCGTYLCEAGTGYDAPTGLGSLHGVPETPPPEPVTGDASSIGQTEATLSATVTPHGVEVEECRFEYGATEAYGSSVPCSSPPGSGTSPVPVSAPVAALSAETVYHFRVAIAYPGGSGRGGDATFTTLGHVPAVSTGEASAITQTSATLSATVDPNGFMVGACEFQYGPTTSYGAAVPCASLPGAGRSPVTVSALLTDLTANGAYHYRIAAANQNGMSYGDDRTVTLLPMPPDVTTEAPSAVTATSATLNATVDPHGAMITACTFEFNSAEVQVPCASTPDAGEGSQAVSAAVDGLQPGAAFRYRIVAANGGGASYGHIREFSTPAVALAPVSLKPPGPEPAAPSPVPAAYAAKLTTTKLVVGGKGYLHVRLRCLGAVTGCRGTIALRTLRAVTAGRRRPARRVLTLASGSFAARNSRLVSVRLRLSQRARRLLARSRVLRARATLLTHPQASDATATARASQTIVTLRAAPARHVRRG